MQLGREEEHSREPQCPRHQQQPCRPVRFSGEQAERMVAQPRGQDDLLCGLRQA